MIKPIYIFSGFIDSGKTTAIKNTLYDGNFNEGEKTLIICFEQGDVAYDEKFLKFTNTEVEYVNFKDWSKELQEELDKKHEPERIFIEFNGMDNDEDMYRTGFIKDWEIAQVLTTVDASTFKLYINNMKQFMFNHIKWAEVCVLNRSDNQDLRFLRNNLKGINTRLEIIFEDKDGNVSNKLNDSLFDTTKPLKIEDLDYGLWYMDAVDNAQKYEGSEIEINAYFYEFVKEYKGVGIFGRQAMVCCADDVQVIAFTVIDPNENRMNCSKKDTYYKIKGKIHCLDDEQGFKTCVIYAEDIVECPEPQEKLVSFS